MTWLKTDDKFPEHRKIRRLTDAAYRLHHTALCACAKDETDGLVTERDLAEMEHGKRLGRHVSALVEAGLWTPVKGGWKIHDFLDYNPSHAKLVADRERARVRQEEWREKKARSKASSEASPDSVTVLSQRYTRSEDQDDERNGVVTGVSHAPVPTRPDPSRPVPSVVDGSPSSSDVTSVTRGLRVVE